VGRAVESPEALLHAHLVSGRFHRRCRQPLRECSQPLIIPPPEGPTGGRRRSSPCSRSAQAGCSRHPRRPSILELACWPPGSASELFRYNASVIHHLPRSVPPVLSGLLDRHLSDANQCRVGLVPLGLLRLPAQGRMNSSALFKLIAWKGGASPSESPNCLQRLRKHVPTRAGHDLHAAPDLIKKPKISGPYLSTARSSAAEPIESASTMAFPVVPLPFQCPQGEVLHWALPAIKVFTASNGPLIAAITSVDSTKWPSSGSARLPSRTLKISCSPFHLAMLTFVDLLQARNAKSQPSDRRPNNVRPPHRPSIDRSNTV
jgi:hypothetical protein